MTSDARTPSPGETIAQDDGVNLVRGGDLGCARLLVLLRQATLLLAPADVIHLETTDPIAPIDLPAWCRMTGHHYLGMIGDHAPPRYGIKVGDNPKPTIQASPWRLS